jgi:hypothetical protein
MNNYKDQYGRYHNKPVTDTDPVPTNNSWLYTAYTRKVGLPVDNLKIKDCFFNHCHLIQEDRNPVLLRNPNKYSPPFSRDEFLGCVELGLLQNYKTFHGWNFSPYAIPKFSLPKLLSQLWELRPSYHWLSKDDLLELGEDHYNEMKMRLFLRMRFTPKHRNYFWQNNLDQLYRFAFSVPLQDRYFILKKWDSFKWYKPSHILYLTIAKIDAKLSPSGLRWLKYAKTVTWNSKKEKLLIDSMVQEFPADHPIRVRLGI